MKANSGRSEKSETKHTPNPCHVNKKISEKIPHFTVNIPLETDEHLCLIAEDNNIILEKERSNPFKIMMDKRILLKSEIDSSAAGLPSSVIVQDNPCCNDGIDDIIDEMYDLDDMGDIGNPLIKHHNYIDRNTSNSSYTTQSNDEHNCNTHFYERGALTNKAPPTNQYISGINDKPHQHSTMGTIKQKLIKPENNFVITNNESSRQGTYKCCIAEDCSPYASLKQLPISPPRVTQYRPNNHSRCNYPSESTYCVKSNRSCNVIDCQNTDEHIMAAPIFEHHQDAHYYHQSNRIFSSNPPSTNRNNQYNNYPHPVSSSYIRKHVPTEKVHTLPHKNESYETDSADAFVEQISKIYLTERPTPRDQEKTKPCNCQKTGCLKLYCECFARGDSCLNCSCKCCLNSPNDFEHWLKASNLVKSRRKSQLSMSPKNSGGHKLRRGCNCRRSLCLKKYCECYDKKIPCNKYCRCIDCCNGVDSQHVRKTQKPLNVDAHVNNVATSSGESTSYPSTSYTDPNKAVFYPDCHSRDHDSSVVCHHYNINRIHKPTTVIRLHSGPHRDPVIQFHHNHSSHPKQHSTKLHSSQSSNDLINRQDNNPNRKLPYIHSYIKSNSTPNLTVYSTQNKNNRGGYPENSSSSKINDRSYNSGGINNKQMMNEYLSLIARNPDNNE